MKVLRPHPVRHAVTDRSPHPHMRDRHQQLSRDRHRDMTLVAKPLVGDDASRLAATATELDAVRTNADHDSAPVADRLSDLRSQLVVAEAEARPVVELE